MKPWLLTVLFWFGISWGQAYGQAAEEIRSQAWCRQVVELAHQRNENPAQQGIICEIDYIQPPDYWRCVLDSMQEGKGIVPATDICMKSHY